MEIEVAVPLPSPADFNFDSGCSTPYISAPSSPQRFGNFFFSAPASPTRVSAFFHDFDPLSALATSPGAAISSSEERLQNREDGEDFEFDFSGQLERTSLSADELFDCGKIKPLKPPTGIEANDAPQVSPKNSVSSRRQKRDSDPFAAAAGERSREEQSQSGRGRRISSSSSTSSSNSANSTSVASSSSKGYSRIWRLRDILLFRSASEGRAERKDPLRKYSALLKKSEDARNSSFRSTESGGSVSHSQKKGKVSAHELHYTANRAVSEDLRKKTFLPYRRDLLGCLGFGSGVHEISRGIGSLTRG